jgi:glycerol-3-phosphate dehydrogenase
LDYLHEDPGLGERITANSAIIKAEIVHVVRQEMAQTLADVVLRRTGLGAAGPPDIECLIASGAVMASELGWDQLRVNQEIDKTIAAYPLHQDRTLQKLSGSSRIFTSLG